MDYEAEKLELEKQKLALERYKADLQARQAKWISISVAVPIIVALVTVSYGFWSAREAAKLQFQLEAAKSAMQSKTDAEIKGRLELYQRIFPNQLPDNFALLRNLATSDAGEERSVEARIRFFEALAKTKDATPQKLIETWRNIFTDAWAREPSLHSLWTAEERSSEIKSGNVRPADVDPNTR
jgi:hypothetical protein